MNNPHNRTDKLKFTSHQKAIEGNWTPDLFITNEVLCH